MAIPTGGYSAAGTAADTSKAPPLPDELAQWVVPGSSATVPNPAARTSPDAAALAQLARFFKLDPRSRNLENEVISALADHFNLPVTALTTPATMGVEPGSTVDMGRAGVATTPARATSTPGGRVPNTKALQEIAQAAGLETAGRATLSDIAASVTGSSEATPPGVTTPGLTAGEEYTNFVKALSNPEVKEWTPGEPKETFKAYMASWLAQGNYLNLSANQGTPDNASVAAAYAQLLSDAHAGNTTVQQAYDAKVSSGNLPSGAAPTQTVSETAAFVQGMGEKLGIYLSPTDITKISNMYEGDVTNAGGPTTVQDEIKNTVVQYFNPNDPRNPPGAANDMYQKVLQSANDYGIPVASADILNWVVNGIKNSAGDSYSIAQAATDTAAAAATHYQALAAGLYPSLAGQIQAGQTVSTLISPYNSITAEYTGVPSTTLSDPGSAPGGPTGKFYAFLQGARDPKTGNPALMTMDAWKQKLMQDPQYGFDKTQGGQDMAEQLTSAILNEFGRVNTTSSSTPVTSLYSPDSALRANV